jgi:hypothetical protein
VTVSIDLLDCRYAVPRGEGEGGVRERFDRIAATALPAALRNRVEPLPAADELCFIEQLEIDTIVGPAAGEQQIAEQWAESLWVAISKRLRDHDGVVAFRGRADYLASFIIDLLAGETRWYHAAQAASSPADRALQGLLDDPDAGREALAEVHHRGRLHELLLLLGEPRIEELVQRCLVPSSPDVVSPAVLRTWSAAIRSLRTAARFAPSGRNAFDAVVLYFETLAAHPRLGPDVNLARFIVRLLDAASACKRNPAIAEELERGDFASVRPLLPSAEHARWIGSMLNATSPRELLSLIAVVDAQPATETERIVYTDYAGLFLLATSVNALELELAPEELFLVALQCAGDDEAARRDAGIAAFANLTHKPHSFVCRDELIAAGSSVLQHFAARLGAFADSSPAYLRKNFFHCSGMVSISAARISVRFLTCPLRVVLRMMGVDGTPVPMPWNEGRVLELHLE